MIAVFDPADADLLVDRPQMAVEDCPGCAGTGEGQTDYTICTQCRGRCTVLVPIVEDEDKGEVAHG